ncbi:UDP-glycosyltransferase [Ramlibacter sp. MAHUQ-53]|uniref:UDP-glycosyltransferase n=1 Tax=unclassified Ramlibacter TaxID=2617605 RepID=UPI00362A930D
MKKVLFACYGSGHVKMVVPVARALRDQGLAEVQVLGLTTAAGVIREAGLPLLQVKDFVRPGDERALEHGRRLCAAMGQVADPDETAAYLGLSYAELEDAVGAEEAARRYARDGRQAFLPLKLLERIVGEVRPDVVFATNSPRAERAAIAAAGTLGIPSVCLVDLFAVDEVRWIGQPGYADAVCVLNEEVRRFLVAAGRRPEEIRVTGNPAFDRLNDAAQVQAGAELRRAQGWEGRRVVLWPEQAEPALHPFDGRPGDPTLPDRAREALLDWVALNPDAVLCVRPRAGDAPPPLPDSPQVRLTGQDWPLAPLLHAVDAVVTLTSTVGLEGHLAGARLVQVSGSVFDEAMPLGRFGIADQVAPVEGLVQAVDRCTRLGRREAAAGDACATRRVAGVVAEFL